MDVHSKVIPFELHPMGFIEVFTRLGANTELLLKDTGIHRSFFGRRGDKISYTQQTQLLKNGIRLCNTPGLGLLTGMKMDWGYNGSVGSVVTCSPSLKNAGAAMRRFLPIAQPHYNMLAGQPSVYVDKDGIMINPLRILAPKHNHPELDLFEIEYRLAVTLRIYDLCGNKQVDNTEVNALLAYPKPAHAYLYDNLPCNKVTFGAKQSAVSCHYQFLIEPWRELRSATYKRIIEQCENELNTSHLNVSVASKVRWHISYHFNEQVTLEQISEQLGLSPRALTRKLANENTNFRHIVHQVRMELTALHLQASSLSVDEVAELMGFSSSSSLRRAIKNWSGKTAGALREDRTISPTPGAVFEDSRALPA
ncbi:helix-turn-helix domain-containing protein [Pseudomaricurvus sp.]|uniref:AraC family transcriptional regulator n=1 Tax=Pseudomaricurvus sp. TaxID=2004510 RepID=UPI003F6A779C